MCTSFMYRGDDTIIAMNYDNHGKNLKLASHMDDLFLVTLHSFGRDRPLFGIRSDGVMANQQVVDPCPAGKFRLGFTATHTAKLLEKVLLGRMMMPDLKNYLAKHTVINPPKNSLHTLIANSTGDSCIIEPGRGIEWYAPDARYVVMSNCSVCDAQRNGAYQGMGVDRQTIAEDTLASADHSFGVEGALRLLDSLHQTDPVWNTEFSFVYSHNENKVYYCYDHQYDNLMEYQMQK